MTQQRSTIEAVHTSHRQWDRSAGLRMLVGPEGEILTWGEDRDRRDIQRESRNILHQHAIGSLLVGANVYSNWRKVAERAPREIDVSTTVDGGAARSAMRKSNRQVGRAMLGGAFTAVPIVLASDALSPTPPLTETAKTGGRLARGVPGIYAHWSWLNKSLDGTSKSKLMVPKPRFDADAGLDDLQMHLNEVGFEDFIESPEAAEAIPERDLVVARLGETGIRAKAQIYGDLGTAIELRAVARSMQRNLHPAGL